MNVSDTGTGYVSTGPGALYYARRIVSLLFGILFVLLGVRIVLLLLVANPGNEHRRLRLLRDRAVRRAVPRHLRSSTRSCPATRTLDIAALVALIGWLLIYVLIMAILRIGDRSASD